MAAIVIADASPLIALARVGGLSWLQQLFTEVMVTDVVFAEVLTGRYPDTEAPIRQARAAGWLKTAAIANINDAPVVTSGNALRFTTISEDDVNNSGDLISTILASGTALGVPT